MPESSSPSPRPPQQPTAAEARQSLHDHAADKGREIHAKYGPHLGWNELQQLLADRKCVRYPCEIVFDGGPLEAGEFACPVPKGERPEEGFTIYVHPYFMTQLDRVPWLVLYQLVAVNYGQFAGAAEAEVFGANALGLDRETYYTALCEMADGIA